MNELDRASSTPEELALVQTQAALPHMVGQLTRLGCQLDIHAVDDDRWSGPLRTLFQVDALGGDRLVAVAGGQGAGKTTLLRNLYPEAAEWLVPTIGRGERMPVAVVEGVDVPKPRGKVVRRKPRSTELETETYETDRLDSWQQVLAGDDTRLLLVRLEVPLGFWGLDQAGFVLLPGFERLRDQYWQTLMRIVLATSAAAVVVTDEARLADAMQQQIVQDVRTAGLADAAPVQVMVALNRCQGKPAEAVATLTERSAEVYDVQPDLVVPIGWEPDSPAGWPDRFQRAARQLLPAAGHARRHQVQLLRDLVRVDVREVITLARGARDRQLLEAHDAGLFAELMQEFDDRRNALLDALDRELRRRFDGHLAAARADLDSRMSGEGWTERRKVFEDWLRADPSARNQRLGELVEASWDTPAVQALQRDCLDADIENQQRVVMAGTAITTAQDFRPLLQLHEIDPSSKILHMAIRLLPVMTLEARAFTLGFADPMGHIEVPDSDTLEEGVERLRRDRRTMLAGATILLGGADLAVDGNLDAPGVLAGAFTRLLTGGGAAATGGGAAGAAAAGPALLVAAAALAAGVTIQAANRAIKRRNDLAHHLLMAQRLAAVEQIRTGTEELLMVAREILVARLRYLLRMDNQTMRRFELAQAIADAEHARARMLETVDGGHLV